MTSWGVLVISWAYLLGLLATGVTETMLASWISVAGCGVLLIGIVASWIIPRYWQMGPTTQQWWIAGLVGLVGASYCILRSPQPAPNDISQFVSGQERQVFGQVMQMPQTTRQQKGRFFLQAQSVRGVGNKSSIEAPRGVSGKLYVTAARSPSKKLYPGQLVELTGEIYAIEQGRKPDKSSFGDYLAKQGCFAGFRTHWIEFLPNQTPPRWALWKWRARIVSAQGRWLGEPAGNLLSAMTLGRKAVDLPFDVKDAFIQAGLAHTLAASGFHVSLILGLVLGALKSRRPRVQALVGVLALAIYTGLTGLQPSVVRAAVMGMGVLIGLFMQRQVKPLGCLLVAVNLILLCNPQWIWDVGFQLSAMATLGLIVSVPWLVQWLDWLPLNVATVLAVPIAAYGWTMPLQLHYFEVLPSYSILLNGIATPLVVGISMGGFVSAIAASIWPVIGSAIAANLYYPIHWLIYLVERFNQLPGNAMQIEGFAVWKVVAAYSLYAAVCIWLWWRQKDEKSV
ncbi:MAG: ComEC/Rec2 family competence protein [Phormidesmis sp.]